MKQVIQNARTGALNVTEVPSPQVRAGHILVRTRASLISAGTERMVVDFARKSLAGKARARPDLVAKVLGKVRRDGLKATFHAVTARLDEPLPLGYSAAGIVEAVGGGLEGAFRVGERVAIAGAGLANHAEVNVVPRNLAAPIPEGVSDNEACYGTLATIAMHSVRNLGAGLGDFVAVLGAGLLGQIAAQLAGLAGSRVIVLDYDTDRLDLARTLGAEAVFDLAESGVTEAIMAHTGGRGCDGIIIAAATKSAEPFETAAAIARDRARVCMVGMTGTAFPYAAFMKKELNIIVSRSYGPGRYDPDFENAGVKYPDGWVRWTETENLADCLRLMSLDRAHRLNVGALTTHDFLIGDAETAYQLVTGDDPCLGVVLTYPERTDIPVKSSFATPAPTQKATAAQDGVCVLGMIGAGGFARGVLLPMLQSLPSVTLKTIATRRGANAEQTRDTFGFAEAATDPDQVIDDPAINAVLIATRHDSHADLTARALAAGKSVLVEKPLGLSNDEIDQVVAVRQKSNGFFQVGFNRRFAPLMIRARDSFKDVGGPKFILIRVNAGPVPRDSWVHGAEEGGGRILGEACHFVDLAQFLVGSEMVSVQADAARPDNHACDDITATIRFADGSLATIAYTGLGDDSSGKERIEGYAGATTVTVDNYRTLTITTGGKTTLIKGDGDKGIKAELKSFVAAVAGGGDAPIDESEIIQSSRATLAIMESLRTGARIDL